MELWAREHEHVFKYVLSYDLVVLFLWEDDFVFKINNFI